MNDVADPDDMSAPPAAEQLGTGAPSGTSPKPVSTAASSEAATHPSEEEPAELVSEVGTDDTVTDDADASVAEPLGAAEPPRSLLELAETLRNQGIDAQVEKSNFSDRYSVAFDLDAGRSKRPVRIGQGDATALDGVDISQWRSLERYEVALRGDRVSPISIAVQRLIQAVQDQSSAEDDQLALIDEGTGIRATIGRGTPLTQALMGRSAAYTLRLDSVNVRSTKAADRVVEQVTDSLSLDLAMSVGIALTPRRLESRRAIRRTRPAARRPLSFPRNAYPHAPVALYQAGRDRGTSPLIRYWSFYQVLEYFFPTYHQAEALRHLQRHLRSPVFDPHNHADVLKAVELATNAGHNAASEQEQLNVTLRAIVSPEEVQALVGDASPEFLARLAARVYDIRCQIVHSKSSSPRGEGPGLLPGTHHDDLVAAELPLISFLAEQALAASAQRLMLPSLASELREQSM
jgi:hypothetical protein